MKIIEFKMKVYLLKDIPVTSMLEQISKLVDTCLVTEGMEETHKSKAYKFYTYNGFFPLEPSGVYGAGKIYTVMLRTVSEEVAKIFSFKLEQKGISSMKALTVEKREIVQKQVEKIFSITPVILKFDKEGYWREHHSIETFEERLKVGLIKKYNSIFHTKLEENFDWLTSLKFDNKKPVANNYKDIILLGDKITIQVAENEIAQQLAWLAVGTGLGEMNARGFGFVNYRYL